MRYVNDTYDCSNQKRVTINMLSREEQSKSFSRDYRMT